MQVLREDQLKIGSVHVAAASGSLTLNGSDPDQSEIRLDPGEVAELLSFLRSIVLSPNDRRGAYRVRIPAACGFLATVFTEDGHVSCSAMDLSLTGVRLQPASPDAPGLEEGSAVQVLLEFEDASVISDAIIVRRSGGECGLSFRAAGPDGVDPLPGLARLVRQLERYWVAEGWKA